MTMRFNNFFFKNRHKLKYRKLHLDTFFYCDGGQTLEHAAKEAADSSFLEIFKTLLDKALSNLL